MLMEAAALILASAKIAIMMNQVTHIFKFVKNATIHVSLVLNNDPVIVPLASKIIF